MTRIREYGATEDVGVLATYGYDDLGRRTSLTFGNGESASYQYDSASRLSQLSRDLGGLAAVNDLTLTFSYNPASQIVSTARSNPGSGPGQADPYAWTGHGSGSTSTTANGLNQLAGWNGTLAYDAKGNMISDGTRSYTYDSENRLSLPPPAFPYHYDPLGRLAGAGAPLAIHYENYVDGLIAERLPGSPTLQYRHVFGPGTDEPIVWYVGSDTNDRRFLHADERGSIVAVTDSSANLLAINRYDEYGKTQTGAAYGRFLYTGQRYFAASGLYYYKNRFYHPGVGRFMQPDPIGYGAGMNLYAYVGGDPVNFTDPWGLNPAEDEEEGDEQEIFINGPSSSGGGRGGRGGAAAAALLSARSRGGIGVQLLDGGRADPDVTCLSEDCWDVAINRSPGKTKFYFNGKRFILDTRYRQPWYAPYFDYGFVIAPPLLAAGAIAAPQAAVAAPFAANAARTAAMNPSSRLFARGTGRLNSNNVLRIGQGWKGSALYGKPVFRVSIGHRTWPSVPGLPPFPWHVP